MSKSNMKESLKNLLKEKAEKKKNKSNSNPTFLVHGCANN